VFTVPILCVDEAYSLLQRLTSQGKSTSQMSLSTERLCRCYDGDFWYRDFYGQWGNKGSHFNLQKQILVFQDGTEAPEDFNLPTYTRNKGIKYPYKAKVSERLYLLHISEQKDIPEDQWSEIFISHDMCHVDRINVAQKALRFHPPFDEWLKANKIIDSLHIAYSKSEGCK
ncbi:unnamed protein product, partial [Porites lobata]